AAGPAEVPWAGRLGPPPPADRTRPPGRHATGPARRRADRGPLSVPQEGDPVRRRRTAVVRPPRQARQLPGRPPPRPRPPARARPGGLPPVPDQGVGR